MPRYVEGRNRSQTSSIMGTGLLTTFSISNKGLLHAYTLYSI